VPSLKRVPIEPGSLALLMDALHQLHLVAGQPSMRELERDVGGGVASHAAIHNVFTASKLPAWRLVEPLVKAMARRANRDERAEVERVRALWADAAHQGIAPTEPRAGDFSGNAADQTGALGFSQPISYLLPDVLGEIEALGTNKATGVFRVPTGFSDLDGLLGGWPQGYLIVVAGRPSSGKTNLLLQFCRAASIRYRLPAMLISGEMNSRDIQSRLLSAEALIRTSVMMTGQISEKEWGRLARVMQLVHDSPIHIATPPDFALAQIDTEVNRLVREAGLKLLLIDNLQWATEGEGSSGKAVESTLRRLKKLAEAAKIPIIITSHAQKSPPKREGTPWGDPMPWLMHSDAIERVADVVIILRREDQYNPESPYAGEAFLIVARNRNGPTVTIDLACQLHYCRFLDVGPNGYVVNPDKDSELIGIEFIRISVGCWALGESLDAQRACLPCWGLHGFRFRA
jgi:KaiC/GvpD/RAD55 family RecA-like ATPase